MFDGMVRENCRCEIHSSVEIFFISVEALEAQGLRGTLREGVLKMFNSSLIILKVTRRNNLYYLKDSAASENLVTSECLDGDSTRLWQMRLGHAGMDSLQALVK